LEGNIDQFQFSLLFGFNRSLSTAASTNADANRYADEGQCEEEHKGCSSSRVILMLFTPSLTIHDGAPSIAGVRRVDGEGCRARVQFCRIRNVTSRARETHQVKGGSSLGSISAFVSATNNHGQTIIALGCR